MNKVDKLAFVKEQLTEVIQKHAEKYSDIGEL